MESFSFKSLSARTFCQRSFAAIELLLPFIMIFLEVATGVVSPSGDVTAVINHK